ncbi:MAG: hypothetical protein J6T60_04490, partial [Bacteroidales bacterium]|nr:hypothetical protein [Bacteroidales bacterium]
GGTLQGASSALSALSYRREPSMVFFSTLAACPPPYKMVEAKAETDNKKIPRLRDGGQSAERADAPNGATEKTPVIKSRLWRTL